MRSHSFDPLNMFEEYDALPFPKDMYIRMYSQKQTRINIFDRQKPTQKELMMDQYE